MNIEIAAQLIMFLGQKDTRNEEENLLYISLCRWLSNIMRLGALNLDEKVREEENEDDKRRKLEEDGA